MSRRARRPAVTTYFTDRFSLKIVNADNDKIIGFIILNWFYNQLVFLNLCLVAYILGLHFVLPVSANIRHV